MFFTPFAKILNMALPQVVTPLGRIDLTKLDYNGIIDQINNIIRTDPRFKEKFTSFFESDAAVMLIELFAQIAHMNNLRLDFLSNELSWVNAEQPQTILNFLPLIDYRLPSVKSSTTPIFAAVENQAGQVSPVQFVIPGRTRLSPVNLENNASVAELLAGPKNYTGDIILAPNIRTYRLNMFSGVTDFVDVTVTKPENFTFKINQTNVIDDSIQIFLIEENNQFELLDKVNSFITQLADLPQYIERFDFDGRPTIAFGNRFFGGSFDGLVETSPSTYKKIRVYYRYLEDSNGQVTNYAPGALDETIDFFSPAINDNITLRFFNQVAGVGGDNIPTLDQVRQIAPLTIRTADKAVTNEDYEIFISQSSLVKDVIALTPIEEPNFNIPVFFAHIFVTPNRLNGDFLPTVTPTPSNKMPEVLPGETIDEYENRMLEALTNFYNLSGLETKASITSAFTAETFPVVQNVTDRMRIAIDTDDIVSGFVDIKFAENINKPITDIVSEINETLISSGVVSNPVASINSSNNIVLESQVFGDGGYLQLLGNPFNAFDNGILEATYNTIGFSLNEFSVGTEQTGEASALQELVQSKRIIGIESRFKPCQISPFRIQALVYYNRNFQPNALEETIRNALLDEFSYQSSLLGQSVRFSRIGNVIQNVDGVEFVQLQNFTDLEASINQLFFILDEVIIDNFPSEFPDLIDRYRIELTMVRSRS